MPSKKPIFTAEDVAQIAQQLLMESKFESESLNDDNDCPIDVFESPYSRTKHQCIGKKNHKGQHRCHCGLRWKQGVGFT